jgi:hypothetical protein
MIKLIVTTAFVFSLSLTSFYILILAVSRNEKFKKLRKNKTKYSVLFSACIAVLFVLMPPINDNDTATIKFHQGQFVITLSSKRTGLKNDSRSITKQPYYESLILTVPKQHGFINAQEFIVGDLNDSTSLTGRLIVGPWKITVDLYHGDKPTRWNTNYKIVKQKFVPD